MNNPNKAIEIEGELDEEEFQEIVKISTKENTKIPQEEEKNQKNDFDYSNIETLEQMMKSIQNFYKQETFSAIKECEELSKEQMKSFDILEKFQNELYNKEMIEIKETFGLIPVYLKKISEIKEKKREIEKKINMIKSKKNQQKN